MALTQEDYEESDGLACTKSMEEEIERLSKVEPKFEEFTKNHSREEVIDYIEINKEELTGSDVTITWIYHNFERTKDNPYDKEKEYYKTFVDNSLNALVYFLMNNGV